MFNTFALEKPLKISVIAVCRLPRVCLASSNFPGMMHVDQLSASLIILKEAKFMKV